MTQRESMPMWLGTMSLASRMPRCPGAVVQVAIGRLAAEVVGDAVVDQRVGRRDGVRVAAQLLDLLRGVAALPQADQPEAGEARAGASRVELLVRDLVQAPDRPAVCSRQLVEPDVGALRHQHHARHPVADRG